jgi:hypothetical protein
MVTGHERLERTKRIRDSSLKLINKWQTAEPGALMSRAYVALRLADTLQVTRQATSQHISREVADGRLMEIFPKPDWKVDLPGGEDLPPVYAAQDGSSPVYRLQYNRPEKSRGAGQNSFVITPDGLAQLLPTVRTQLGLPQRDPDGLPYYVPGAQMMLRPETYRELVSALIEVSPMKLTASQAGEQLDPLLKVLRLKPPVLG